MAVPVNPPKPVYKNSSTALFVYFDGAGAFGVMNGTVEIELTARTLIPSFEGPVNFEVVPTARLRCSLTAAASLRDAVDKALELAKSLAEQSGSPGAGAASKLN